MADGDGATRAHDSAPEELERVASQGEDGLAEYGRRKLQLAELIRALMNVAAERRDEEKRRAAQELLARLAEDAFQLAVVGQFSRGKSTLMNAILGDPYLPTGALPMTSVVTSVRYGSRPRVLVQRGGSSFPIETTLDELARFVAQASREREELRVVSAQVEVPAEILRLGFTFVDTPGIGSAIAANTATTESFLPEADAVILVTSFDAPLSEAELAFLAKVRDHVEKLFLVVNKLDLVSEDEAESILAYVRERVGADGDADLRVFATSARRALDARMDGDGARLAESGLPELERPLVRFLMGEKSRVFLHQVAARAERLLRRQRLDLELGGIAQSAAPEQEARRDRLERGLADLIDEVREAARVLRERIEAEFPAALAEQAPEWPAELELVLRPELERRWQKSVGRKARARLEATRDEFSDSAQGLVEGWFHENVSEARSQLLRFAADEIARLETLQESVDGVGAHAFGLATAADAAPEVAASPADLPQLAVRPLAFDLPLELPWWLSVLPRTRSDELGRRRLLEALERGIVSYSGAARQALEEAATAWGQNLGTAAEAETRRATDRLHERLQLPGSERHLALLEEIERRLTAFRAALLDWHPQTGVPEPSDGDAPPRTASARSAAACVICERIGRVPFEYLAHAQYELATRERSRAEHAASGGFCALHTWQYAETASDLGVALAYAELAESASQLLHAAGQTASREADLQEAVGRFIAGGDRCPVCRAVAEAQREAVAALIENRSAEPEDEPPPALCIPHLAAVLASEPDVERGRLLAATLADVLGRAAEDMRTYALKRESLRRQLLNEEERESYLQTIARVAGHRELARPWRIDDRLPE